MKSFFAFLIFSILTVVTANGSIDRLNFRILPGKLHAGGKAAAHIVKTDSDRGVILAQLDYEVFKRAMVPVPDDLLKGDEKQELPIAFLDERGYLDLEKTGSLELEDAIVYHEGRAKVGTHLNGHHVKIVAKNGKSVTEVYYHPHIPELGWGKVKLTLFTPIPLLRNYSMEAELTE